MSQIWSVFDIQVANDSETNNVQTQIIQCYTFIEDLFIEPITDHEFNILDFKHDENIDIDLQANILPREMISPFEQLEKLRAFMGKQGINWAATCNYFKKYTSRFITCVEKCMILLYP